LTNVKRKGFRLGIINKENGRASLEYIDKGLELIKKGDIDCLVTAPVSKEAIKLAGFDFEGHTEYLAQKTNTKKFIMMLIVDKLRVSVATRHIPLSVVAKTICIQSIFNTIKLSIEALKKYFGITNPRVGVCGLNPHAGEGGLIGSEERRIIIPAIKKARRFNRDIYGPLAADSIFSKALINRFDCIVAMYHDQGLIPVKMVGFDRGVNLTFGLPFIRTSPDHGTAFDIAGKNVASANSLIEAIKLAVRCQRLAS
jgi:4-hydroxythreonine-4-phosphate dehydrogenase